MTTRVSVDAPNHSAFIYRFQPGTSQGEPEEIKEGRKQDVYVFGDSYVLVTEKAPDGRSGGVFMVARTGFFFKEWRWTYFNANGKAGFSSTEGYKNFQDCLNSIPTPLKIANSSLHLEN